MKRSPMPARREPMKRTPAPRSKPHLSELPRNREMAFKRDGWTCRLYGVVGHECAGPLVAHHVVLRSQGGTHDVDNLVTLCDQAHRWVHANPAEARLLGLYGRTTA